MDYLDHKGQKEIWDLLDQKVHREKLDSKVKEVFRDQWDPLVSWDPRVILEFQGAKAILVTVEREGLEVRRAVKVTKETSP